MSLHCTQSEVVNVDRNILQLRIFGPNIHNILGPTNLAYIVIFNLFLEEKGILWAEVDKIDFFDCIPMLKMFTVVRI